MGGAARTRILSSQLEQRAYERLRDEIVAGVLKPGEQLVETRIAKDLGVSKTPVREALIRLQRDGLVEIAPHRPARVLRLSAQDVREILELRLLLESEIARKLARTRPPTVIDALAASITESKRAARTRDLDRLVDSVTAFSDIQTKACVNSRMAKLLVDLRSALLLIGNTSWRGPGREKRSIAEHDAILAAICAGDPDAAAKATADHIRSIERDAVPEI